MSVNNYVVENIDSKLRKYFARSSYWHLGLVFIFLVGSFSINFFNEKRKRENIRIVESSVRVDVVAMPELTIKELKSMGLPQVGSEVEPTIKKVVKEDPVTDKDFQTAKKKVNFLDMAKKLAQKNVKVKKNKKANTKKNKQKGVLDGIDRGSLKKLVLQGNKISKGTSITGSGHGGSDAFSIYLGKLPDVVKPFWSLPSYLLDKEYKCRIRIFLNANGKLIKTEIYESSGNQEYDNKALMAVKQAAPFPQLSEEFKSRGISGDIVLGFPL